MKIIEYTELTPELAAAGCLVLNMPNDAYHTYAGISKSGLDLIDRSPAHFAYREAIKTSRAMVLGQAIHCAVLEPELYEKQYMKLKDIKVRTATEYKQAIKVHGDDFVLVAPEADYIEGMKQSINNNIDARLLLDKKRLNEIAVFATDPETGTLVKCKFDTLLTDSLIGIDLKKTQDASMRQFEKSIASYRYHVQDAFYSDVFLWATGQELLSFSFLAVEERMPHFSKLYECDSAAKQYGRKLYRQNLNTYAECLKNNDWPMPDGGLEYIGLPYWAADPDMEI